MAYVKGPHFSQYDPGNSNLTRQSGCTWTTGSNGAAATTKKRPSPDTVHAQVKYWEETNSATPGWSMDDLDLAMSRLDVPFANRNFSGWGAVVAYHDAGYYLAVQGDSDQFGNSTCSGAFNGDHCIGIHPEEDELGRWLIDDPICKTARYEYASVIKRYALKLDSRVRFGQFTAKVPKNNGLILRYGGVKAKPYPDRTRTDEPFVNVHTKPTIDSRVKTVIKVQGTLSLIYQWTDEGDEYKGSRKWGGNKAGDSWIHSARLFHEGGST